MNKTMMWVIGAVILIVVGGGLFTANQQSKQANDAKMQQEKAAMKAKESFDKTQDKDAAMEKKAAMEKGDTTKQDDAMPVPSGVEGMKKADSRYVEYSKAVLNGAASNRRVLYFYANWCPICKPADADFKANSSKIPSDLTVLRVNYNDTDTDSQEKDLAKKYGITYQHTFVQIDAQGKEITKWNGGKTDELLANIK